MTFENIAGADSSAPPTRDGEQIVFTRRRSPSEAREEAVFTKRRGRFVSRKQGMHGAPRRSLRLVDRDRSATRSGRIGFCITSPVLPRSLQPWCSGAGGRAAATSLPKASPSFCGQKSWGDHLSVAGGGRWQCTGPERGGALGCRNVRLCGDIDLFASQYVYARGNYT